MGQENCCENVNNAKKAQLTLSFSKMNSSSEPVEFAKPNMISDVESTTRIFNGEGPLEGIDGHYCGKAPDLPQIVQARLKCLKINRQCTIAHSQKGFVEHDYFCFKLTGVVYKGQWKKRKPHGQGINYYPNGSVYSGSVFEGIPHGTGKFILSNGDYFQGQVKFGRANGEGAYESQNSVYRGFFKDNAKHGAGEEQGKKFYYKGTFEYGEKKHGLLKYGNNVYEGSFQDDLYHGKGKLTTTEGYYQGNFKEGYQHGYGQFHWKDGSVYKGNYAKGVREGEGQYFNSKNSSISRGIWKDGRLQGRGQYVEPRGKINKCVWNSGKILALGS